MSDLKTWPISSLQRVFPATPAPARAGRVSLDLARNERGSFQVALRHEQEMPVAVSVSAEGAAALDVRVRRVGTVPVEHHTIDVRRDAAHMDGTGVWAPRDPADMDGIGHVPGWVPDPLFDESNLLLPPHETHAFWFTVTPRRGVKPGTHEVRVVITPEQGTHCEVRIPVTVYPVRIRQRRDFPVAQWFYVDALLDAYDLPGFNKRFWQILEAYFRNLAEHGQDTAYVPVFTPPTDGVKRPSQLLRVSRQGKDRYRFDWRDVKHYVDLARRCGLRRFEWTHLFTQWGVRHAIRIYEGQGVDERLLWPADTPATAPLYRTFLAAYLPALRRFLEREGLMKRSFFHVSDEPHGEEHLANYRRARALLAELAPWMKVMDAVSDIEYGRQGITDLPIASIRTAMDFKREGIRSGCYYCCNPKGPYLNRFMDTPLPKIRMSGWLFYRHGFTCFCHWGYNYWYRKHSREMIDPYRVTDAHNWPAWPSGDGYVVYPGPEGPVDSIRWEVFAESLRDYALLQSLGVSRDASWLRALKDFKEFPKDAAWIVRARKRLLSAAVRGGKG